MWYLSFLDELRATLPNAGETFVGVFLSRPSYHEATYEKIYYKSDYLDDAAYYTAHVRGAEKNRRVIQFGRAAKIILDSGEAALVKIVGVGYSHPSPRAVRTGVWTPRDVSISIDADGLSQEQAQRARFIVQYLARGG